MLDSCEIILICWVVQRSKTLERQKDFWKHTVFFLLIPCDPSHITIYLREINILHHIWSGSFIFFIRLFMVWVPKDDFKVRVQTCQKVYLVEFGELDAWRWQDKRMICIVANWQPFGILLFFHIDRGITYFLLS